MTGPGPQTPFSRVRRAFTIFILVLSLFLIAEAVAVQRGAGPIFDSPWPAYWLAAFSVVYFLTVVIGVIFLTSSDFRPNPTRLALDTANSIVFCILAFALVYRFNGISLGDTCPATTDPADLVYFSAVTFSTLGYGDFRPCAPSRLFAAFHAIFGNLHLGLIVGNAFFFAQVMGGSEQDPEQDRQRSDDKEG